MSHFQLRILVRPGDGLGFRLAGAPVDEVTGRDVAERFKALLADRGVGVLAVEQELLDQVPEALLERIGREGFPLLLPFAFPRRWQETGRGEEYVATLIRRAIGYHVKIQR